MANNKITKLETLKFVASLDAVKALTGEHKDNFTKVINDYQHKSEYKRTVKKSEVVIALEKKVVDFIVASGERKQLKDWAVALFNAGIVSEPITGNKVSGYIKDAVEKGTITRTKFKSKSLFGGADVPNPEDEKTE